MIGFPVTVWRRIFSPAARLAADSSPKMPDDNLLVLRVSNCYDLVTFNSSSSPINFSHDIFAELRYILPHAEKYLLYRYSTWRRRHEV